MRPISDTVNKLTNKEDFQKRYEAIKNEVVSHPDIKRFILENQVTDEILNRSLMKLYEYINQSKECNKCVSLKECRNMIQGYHPKLVLRGKVIDLNYDRCPRKEMADEQAKLKSLIKSMYIPRDILEATLTDIHLDMGRKDAVSFAMDFLENYDKDKRVKGLYLYGSFGVGKTYILGAIANELAMRKIPSMLIYVPEFTRELKGSIQEHTLNEKIEAVKKVPVLMLDDIGAESMSSWMRDEILGTILQYRMLENLPTFFTSNFNFKELEHHLTYTQRGEEEKVKAARVMERIKYLATPVELRGENRRR